MRDNMNAGHTITRILLPLDTVLAFAGDGLNGSNGQFSVDCGAGLGFNEWGRLILNLLEGGGLGYRHDALCINPCEVSFKIAGFGLKVDDCKLAVDFGDVAGCGLTVDENNKFAVDTADLAGTGLIGDNCQFAVDPGFLAGAISSQINNNNQPDDTQTTSISYLVDTDFKYKPSGYGYGSGLEITKTYSSLVITRNAGGFVLMITQGPTTQVVQDFNFGSSVVQNVADRIETPTTPNFYVN